MHADLQRIQDRATSYLPYVTGLLVMASLALGYYGFRILPIDDGPMRRDDALFQSIQLFVLDFSVKLQGGVPLPLNIARFLSPALTGYAVLRASMVLLAGYHERLRRSRMSGHVIVCGTGQRGLFVASDAAAGRYQKMGRSNVIAIDPNPEEEAVSACAHRGISLIRGSAVDHSVLVEAGILRASHVFIFSGDDGVNLEIVHAMKATRSEGVEAGGSAAKNLDTLTCYVGVSDLRFASLIPDHRRFLEHPAHMQVQAFNKFQNSARDLWNKMVSLSISKKHQCLPLAVEKSSSPAVAVDDARVPHIFVTGEGDASAAIFEQIAQLAHFANGSRTRITLFGLSLEFDTVKLEPVLDVRVQPHGVLSKEGRALWVSAAKNDAWLVSIVVCGKSEQENLRTTIEINEIARSEGLEIPVFTLTTGSPGIHKFLQGEMNDVDHLVNVHGFGALETICSVDAIECSRLTCLAQQTIQRFLTVGKDLDAGHAPTDSMAWEDAWGRLPEYLRAANRRSAEHIRIKCLTLGVDSDCDDGRNIPDEALLRRHVQTLAMMEHRRWMVQKLLTGWVYGEQTDPIKRTHRDLVEWERLPAAEQAKDITLVRSIPEILEIC